VCPVALVIQHAMRMHRIVIVNLNFLDKFSKILMSNLMKIGQVGAELFHTDGQLDGRTDMTKLIVAFPQSCERA
jgi:hypothetical protein